MDDLRIALLIAGVVVVAGVYAFARRSRRKSARRDGELDFIASEPYTEDSSLGDLRDPHALLEPLSAPHDDAGTGTRIAVDDLGGVFAAQRETSDVEVSVDVSILAGLRASYESTMESTIAPAPPSSSESVRADTGAEAPPAPYDDDPVAAPAAPRPPPAPSPPAAAAEDSLAIDMSRPLVYLTLVEKEKRLAGRAVLDALGTEDFLPGLMQLYYRRSDYDPNVVVGVANMVESGVLDPASLPDIDTPGLVTFMGVPADAAQALKTFNTMVATSRRLAQRLGVTLCDEARSPLTAQAENHMRERVGNIARRSRTED